MIPRREHAYGKKCDFCVPSELGRWDYPARSFTLSIKARGVDGFQSNGGWLACEECSRLIEINDRAALLKRITMPLDALEFKTQQRILDAFFEHRYGERIAFG